LTAAIDRISREHDRRGAGAISSKHTERDIDAGFATLLRLGAGALVMAVVRELTYPELSALGSHKSRLFGNRWLRKRPLRMR